MHTTVSAGTLEVRQWGLPYPGLEVGKPLLHNRPPPFCSKPGLLGMCGCGRLEVQWQEGMPSVYAWRWLGAKGTLRFALTLALAAGVAGVGRRLLQGTPQRPRLHPGLRHLLL